MEWSSAAVLEFLYLYENEPAIWNPKHPLHKNRSETADAWARIAYALRLVKCSVNDLKKKKESLMSSFRMYHTKVTESYKSGAGANELFKPKWFAYETMERFLKSVYQPQKTINSEDLDGNTVTEVFKQEVIEEHEHTRENVELQSIETITNHVEYVGEGIPFPNELQPPKRTASKRRRDSDLPSDRDRMTDAYEITKTVPLTAAKDECSLYGELLAIKLRALPQNTREVVMHDIDNLMFLARPSYRRT